MRQQRNVQINIMAGREQEHSPVPQNPTTQLYWIFIVFVTIPEAHHP